MTSAQAIATVEQPQEVPPGRGALEPWALLPSQLSGGPAHSLSGERRLMAAILGDAIQVYLKGRRSGAIHARLFREAEDWIESRDHRGLFSFETVCDVLHVDADRLRVALRAHAQSARRGGGGIPVDACRLRVARGRKMRL